MRLGKYFTLKEMTATNSGIDNPIEDLTIYINLTRLVSMCLDPLRLDCGALKVTSGYRSIEVNEAVGGAAHSYHRMGLAADLQSDELHVLELVDRVEFMALPFDKLIMEYGKGRPWLHWQIKAAGETNRKEVYSAQIVDGKMKYTRVM